MFRETATVELADGQVPLARIVPIEPTHTVAELDKALRASSGLGEDAEDFALDVQSGKESLGKLDDPWES